MKIKFYGTMQIITGKTSEHVAQTQATTVNQVFDWLFAQFPQIQFFLHDALGNVDAQIPVFVNGRNPRLAPDGLNAPLQADDTICLFSPISSGKINVEVMHKARQNYNG